LYKNSQTTSNSPSTNSKNHLSTNSKRNNDLKKYESIDLKNIPPSDENRSIEAGTMFNWKNNDYFKLPKNVQVAIDKAQNKQHHSEFYYKLKHLNEKL